MAYLSCFCELEINFTQQTKLFETQKTPYSRHFSVIIQRAVVRVMAWKD